MVSGPPALLAPARRRHPGPMDAPAASPPRTARRRSVLDRNGLAVLDREACLRHLAEATFGRIAVTMGALPVVLPVNYRFVDGRIVLRTTVGTKLEAATAGAVVAFEIDEVDPMDHRGWSVLVTGTARLVEDDGELARYRAAGVPRWAPHGADRYVAIEPEIVSGRALLGS